MELAAFILLSIVSIGSAIVVVLPAFRNIVVCALALAMNLVSMAGFFFLLDAQFIGLLQVIVYAGAIMVLILFVLMLLNLGDYQALARSGIFQRILAPLLAVAFGALVVSIALTTDFGSAFGAFPEKVANFGEVRVLGQELFTRFFYPFEVISLLLVVAMTGAVLLAKRRL